MYWQCYLLYRKYFGDTRYDSFIASQFVLASYGSQGDFLNGNQGLQATLMGKWNDDIAWWGLAALTGAETYGPDALINPAGAPDNTGKSWFDVANTTFFQMLQQWDTSTCGGGIYWSRDRNSRSKDYKSTITNGQAIEMAARLYRLKPDPVYRKWADDIYAWMKKYVVQPDYTVIDGFNAVRAGDTPAQCASDVTTDLWSYQPGVMIPGLAILYNVTQNATYLEEAQKLLDAALATFVDSSNIIYDPICRLPAQTICRKNPGGYTWALFRGLAEMYTITPNTTAKARIEAALEGTALDNGKNCPGTAADWNCIRTLDPVPKEYTFPNGTNPRDQIETMEILTSLGIVKGFAAAPVNNSSSTSTPTTTSAVVTGSPASATGAAPTTKSGAGRRGDGAVWAVMAGLLALLVA
ncbi:hydrolase 76 protein [Phlyctochytrium bullatum]|nr:hydrolase 76 protein [Phlyctochytrium bullatum]